LLADGATATMGCVDEPYLDGTPNIGVFFKRWLEGFTFGEAAYAAQSVLSWQTTVIGDPLYRPFGKIPRAQEAYLRSQHSPLIEWSHLQFVNMGLVYGMSPAKMVEYLKAQPETSESAVLTEKLGDLYEGEGQRDLALKSWQQALKLNPSPQQAVRLTLHLADKLAAAGKEEQSLALEEKFLKDNPSYPDALVLYGKMDDMAKMLHKNSQAKRYEQEIARLTSASGK
jgi:tetratricopeptide (TPR) repeat protein